MDEDSQVDSASLPQALFKWVAEARKRYVEQFWTNGIDAGHVTTAYQNL